MVSNVGEENFGRANSYHSLKSNSKIKLYPRCANFTQLLTSLKLLSLKVRNWWTNTSLTELLALLKEMFPKN